MSGISSSEVGGWGTGIRCSSSSSRGSGRMGEDGTSSTAGDALGALRFLGGCLTTFGLGGIAENLESAELLTGLKVRLE